MSISEWDYVHQLIRQKRYEAARRVLRANSSPAAKRILAQLNLRYPPKHTARNLFLASALALFIMLAIMGVLIARQTRDRIAEDGRTWAKSYCSALYAAYSERWDSCYDEMTVRYR